MRIALLCLLLSGCTSLDALRPGIATRGAEVSDQALVDATFVLCRGITVGAWLRAFGSDPERAHAWRQLCAERITQTP
jgi:hypothetical protein